MPSPPLCYHIVCYLGSSGRCNNEQVMQEGSEHMLSVVRRQGRDLLPPGSDNPRLEVVRLLAGHTQCVAQVVVALGAGQLPLVSPENCVSVVTTLAVLQCCSAAHLQAPSWGWCWPVLFLPPNVGF